LIQVGCFNDGISKTAEITIPFIISENDDEGTAYLWESRIE